MLATANTGEIGRGFGKSAGEWTRRVEISKEEIPGSKRGMYGYILTYSKLPNAGLLPSHFGGIQGCLHCVSIVQDTKTRYRLWRRPALCRIPKYTAGYGDDQHCNTLQVMKTPRIMQDTETHYRLWR